MSDVHAKRLKDSYWVVKYNEWRPFVIAAPFVGLIIGFFFGMYVGPNLFPRTSYVDRVVTRVVTQEVPVTASQPAAGRNRILTYANAPCDRKRIHLDLPPKTAVTLPKNCIISIGGEPLSEKANSYLFVYDTALPPGAGTVLPPSQIASFVVASELIADSGDDAVHVVFAASPKTPAK